MFRAECKAGTDLGKAACTILSQGKLVGDEIVNAIVASRIARSDCQNGFLLDGYPRTVPQAIFFSSLLRRRSLPKESVIHLDVPDEALVTRLTARRQCPSCLRIYNLISQPPREAGRCDVDSSTLTIRADDQESVIRKRLRAYDELTGPILKWYGPSLVRTIDGSRPAAEVAGALAAMVSELVLASAG
jgi:adenylate kinase